jgi:hypothetical protein
MHEIHPRVVLIEPTVVCEPDFDFAAAVAIVLSADAWTHIVSALGLFESDPVEATVNN